MSGPLVSASAAFVAKNSRIPPFAIEQSLRFDGGASLSRSGTIKGASTFSVWIKRGKLNDTFGVLGLREGTTTNYKQLFFEGSSYDSLGFDNSSGGNAYSNNKFRDPSAWFHVVVVSNTTGTGSKMYINGTEVSYRIQTTTTSSDTTGTIYIGALNGGGSQFNGYLAELHIVDSALDPTDFAEEDENGVWRPIEFTGSYGSNGVYLKFDPTATNGIGHDHSGNGNNFTPSGFVTTGTGTDVMSDTPTTNWCTLNPNYTAVSGATFSEGNLKVAYPSSPPTGMHVGTLATTNAFYVEAKATAATSNQIYLGVETPERGNINNNYPGGGPDGWGYGMNGNIYNNGSTVTDTGTTYTTNDVIGIACDPSSGTIEFFKNGTSVYSGTSVANVPLTICVSQSGGSGNSGTIEINCGQRAFEQSAPSGFSPLNTANLPAPTVEDGSDYFNTVLYNGNTTTQSITGVGFQPSFSWIKYRADASNHGLFDAVRGAGESLNSNTTGAIQTQTDSLTSFDSDGFSLGDNTEPGPDVNYRTGSYVAWNWLAGGSGSSNTDGSITSTVSANPSAGFSIVTYTGGGSAATVGHGLGVAPAMVITKDRNTTHDWYVYHSGLTSGHYLKLNDSVASASDTSIYSSAPSSTVINYGSSVGVVANGDDFVAYCFAEVEGYSKFGSYTGNGSTDGVFIYTGFKPAIVIYKRTDSAQPWYILDTTRDPYNVSYKLLSPNLSSAEDTTSSPVLDFLSNGVKLRNLYATLNASGGTYIFAAFAENPFGGDGVNPATAR